MRTRVINGELKKIATVYWDEETRGFDGKVILIGAKEEDEKGVSFFTSIKDFWQYLTKIDADVINCYSHNGGRFDNMDVIEFLSKIKEIKRMHLIPIHSVILVKVWLEDKRVINFYDSFQIIPLPLRSFGETFGLSFFKGEFKDFEKLDDYNKMDEDTRKRLKEYLERDVLVLEAGMNEFFNLLNSILSELNLNDILGELQQKYTIASISFRVLKEYIRRNFGKDILENEMDKETENFVRRSYAGGRTEAFKLYAEDIQVFDFNSMYPAVMRNGIFPTGKGIWSSNSDYLLDLIRSKDGLGFIEAEVKAPDNLDPTVLWVKKDGHLLFPTGRFKGIYPIPELRKAMELGYEIKPVRGLFYNTGTRVFTNYIDVIYNKRKEAKKNKNHGKSLVLKLLLNSSYGKFAQRRETKTLIPIDKVKGDCFEIIGDFVVEKKENYSNREINPAIASYITAYARLKLYEKIHKYSENICYCDTDSIFLSNIPEGSVEISNELGELNYEGSYDRGYFAGAKLYYLVKEKENGETITKIASKGIPKAVMQKENLEKLYLDLIQHKVKTFQIKRLAGFNEILRRKLYLEKREARYRILIEQEKKVRSTINQKRKVKGNETEPFHLEEKKGVGGSRR